MNRWAIFDRPSGTRSGIPVVLAPTPGGNDFGLFPFETARIILLDRLGAKALLRLKPAKNLVRLRGFYQPI